MWCTSWEVGTSARVAATLAYRESGWPVRVRGEQVSLNLDLDAVPAMMWYTDMVAADNTACGAADIRPDEHCVRAPAGSEAGPCFGDSGSPTLQHAGRHWFFVGMVNRGVDDQCGTTPSVMTDMGQHGPWIT